MSQTLKTNDRFEVKENGLKGTVDAVSFNSILQEWEYYITWDHSKGQHCYMVDDVKTMWNKIDEAAEALPRGYVNQDPDYNPITSVNGYGAGMKPVSTHCDHKWVDIGFTHSKIICKHCDMEQK